MDTFEDPRGDIERQDTREHEEREPKIDMPECEEPVLSDKSISDFIKEKDEADPTNLDDKYHTPYVQE